MPENSDFVLEVLVGSTPLPEYEKDGQYHVESNLATPYSYTMSATESIGGEAETQNWPVTPYSLRITAKWLTDTYYYRVTVDGVKVKGLSLVPGQNREIKGFRDGPCLREFLFSLPRFAKDETDRIEEGREGQIGVISVECWNAMLKTTKYGLRKNFLDFKQANKKDSSKVTQGQHLMATSKAGKVVGSRSLYRSVDNWKLQSLRSSLQVRYHMGHTLQEMGFTLQPITWPKVKKRPHKVKKVEKKAKKKRSLEEESQDGEDTASDNDQLIIEGPVSDKREVIVKHEVISAPPVQDDGEVVDLTLDSDEDCYESNESANVNMEAGRDDSGCGTSKGQGVSVLQKTSSTLNQMEVDDSNDDVNDDGNMEDDVEDAVNIDDGDSKKSDEVEIQNQDQDKSENEAEKVMENRDENNDNQIELNFVSADQEFREASENADMQDDAVGSFEKASGVKNGAAFDRENVADKNGLIENQLVSELRSLCDNTGDALAEQSAAPDLNATVDSEASFVSIDYDSDLLNSSIDSESGLKLHVPSVDPTVQPTGEVDEFLEGPEEPSSTSGEPSTLLTLEGSVNNQSTEACFDPTVQPTTDQPL